MLVSELGLGADANGTGIRRWLFAVPEGWLRARTGMASPEEEPGWEHPCPGQTPCLALQSCSLAPGHISLVIFMKLCSRDQKIIPA